MLGVFLCHSISEAASDSVRKSGQQVQSTPFLPSQHWVTGTNHNAQLLCECWEYEPRFSCCLANTLVTEPFPWAPFIRLKDSHLTLMNVWAEFLCKTHLPLVKWIQKYQVINGVYKENTNRQYGSKRHTLLSFLLGCWGSFAATM